MYSKNGSQKSDNLVHIYLTLTTWFQKRSRTFDIFSIFQFFFLFFNFFKINLFFDMVFKKWITKIWQLGSYLLNIHYMIFRKFYVKNRFFWNRRIFHKFHVKNQISSKKYLKCANRQTERHTSKIKEFQNRYYMGLRFATSRTIYNKIVPLRIGYTHAQSGHQIPYEKSGCEIKTWYSHQMANECWNICSFNISQFCWLFSKIQITGAIAW